jgi:hypothetical protein
MSKRRIILNLPAGLPECIVNLLDDHGANAAPRHDGIHATRIKVGMTPRILLLSAGVVFRRARKEAAHFT